MDIKQQKGLQQQQLKLAWWRTVGTGLDSQQSKIDCNTGMRIVQVWLSDKVMLKCTAEEFVNKSVHGKS